MSARRSASPRREFLRLGGDIRRIKRREGRRLKLHHHRPVVFIRKIILKIGPENIERTLPENHPIAFPQFNQRDFLFLQQRFETFHQRRIVPVVNDGADSVSADNVKESSEMIFLSVRSENNADFFPVKGNDFLQIGENLSPAPAVDEKIRPARS